MISYYELLGLLKKGKQPKEVRLYLVKQSAIYYYDSDHNSYLLKDRAREDYNFNTYLRDSLTDNGSFVKIIEIIK